MFDTEYILQYLPLFEQDLASVRDYISTVLQNPEAALGLVEETEKAIHQRLDNPLAFEPYWSSKEREYPYYRIYVKNYIVWYVVIGNIMEIRRFVYNKRDFSMLL
ncbi:MAG: type II toxin-antitoxin system RelE/ParE family toxin [Defluviitaleaceae bacterium]|nr:type II toxin-antitoxin system RelE/ParE family toxin [Defluviitaleaceae bacterium]